MNLKLALILSLCGASVAHLEPIVGGGDGNVTLFPVDVEIDVGNLTATEDVSSTEPIQLVSAYVRCSICFPDTILESEVSATCFEQFSLLSRHLRPRMENEFLL